MHCGDGLLHPLHGILVAILYTWYVHILSKVLLEPPPQEQYVCFPVVSVARINDPEQPSPLLLLTKVVGYTSYLGSPFSLDNGSTTQL